MNIRKKYLKFKIAFFNKNGVQPLDKDITDFIQKLLEEEREEWEKSVFKRGDNIWYTRQGIEEVRELLNECGMSERWKKTRIFLNKRIRQLRQEDIK